MDIHRQQHLAIPFLAAGFMLFLMVTDELMIHFSFHATTYEYPVLGTFPIWVAWQIAFVALVAFYFASMLILMRFKRPEPA